MKLKQHDKKHTFLVDTILNNKKYLPPKSFKAKIQQTLRSFIEFINTKLRLVFF